MPRNVRRGDQKKFQMMRELEHWALVKHAGISGIGGNKFSLFHWINIVPCPSLLLLLLPLSLNCTVWWLREQRIFSPSGSAAGEEQPVADPVSLWFDDSLQRKIPEYFSLPLLPESQSSFMPTTEPAYLRQPGGILFGCTTPPARHHVKDQAGNH